MSERRCEAIADHDDVTGGVVSSTWAGGEGTTVREWLTTLWDSIRSPAGRRHTYLRSSCLSYHGETQGRHHNLRP